MKRYRLLGGLMIDTARNFFQADVPEEIQIKHGAADSVSREYGADGIEKKFKRWRSIPKASLSVVGSHLFFLEQIEKAYVAGAFYSALTAACCFGERIFNEIIQRVGKEYGLVGGFGRLKEKNSHDNWGLCVSALFEWGVISDPEIVKKYLRLAKIRNDVVHFQKKPLDFQQLSEESMVLIFEVTNHIFGIGPHKKDTLIYFEVPGELYLRKSAESVPFIRAFFLPHTNLVGFKHRTEYESGRFRFVDEEDYGDEEWTDKKFVEMRRFHTEK